jgi:hypothetical protein
MTLQVRHLAAALVGAALAACQGGGASSRDKPGGGPLMDPAGEACAAHAAIDGCLADRANQCYWGPNYGWPVLVDGEPCQPPEGICRSALSPPAIACTVDAADDAACRAHVAGDACLADAEHRCRWTPSMGRPCMQGEVCEPSQQCQTAPTCPPHCASAGPTVSVSGYADCGCMTPPGGVCIAPPGGTATGCAERPACGGADVCACLTGLGTCTPGELPNVCVCDGFAP